MNSYQLAVGIVLAAMALLVLVASAACYEALRQVEDVRRFLDMDDQPLALEASSVQLNSSGIGLPEEIERCPEAIVVFLSGKCGTCLQIANTFRTGVPSFMWIVFQDNDSKTPGFIATTLAHVRLRAIEDRDGAIAEKVGINITPSVLTFRFGDLVKAHGVSSVRQVMALMPKATTPMWVGGSLQTQSDADANVLEVAL